MNKDFTIKKACKSETNDPDTDGGNGSGQWWNNRNLDDDEKWIIMWWKWNVNGKTVSQAQGSGENRISQQCFHIWMSDNPEMNELAARNISKARLRSNDSEWRQTCFQITLSYDIYIHTERKTKPKWIFLVYLRIYKHFISVSKYHKKCFHIENDISYFEMFLALHLTNLTTGLLIPHNKFTLMWKNKFRSHPYQMAHGL